MKIALTGHRPQVLSEDGRFLSLTDEVSKMIGLKIRNHLLLKAGYNIEKEVWEKKECVTLISGMALGVDTIGALVVLKLRKQFPEHFRLECAIPCVAQFKRWKQEDKERYEKILKQADLITYVSKEAYTHYCMQKRNEYMVEQADEVLAIWNGQKSGTGNCIVYALKQGKQVTIVEPKTYEVGVLI